MNSVIVPRSVIPIPNKNELTAAYIISDYFKSDVMFVPRSNHKTPDLLINGVAWELKTPIGNGKRNLQHVISRAIKQSRYIIIDARFSKMHIAKIKNRICIEIDKNKQIKRLLLIDKHKNVVEMSKKV